MKKEELIKTGIITGIIGLLFLIIGLQSRDYNYAKKVYQVYLRGYKLGLIAEASELYKLINEEQKDIKDTYQVQTVYPPNGFKIEEVATYSDNVTTAKEIYEKIKDEDDFTIEGYTVTIKFLDKEKKDIVLNVINQEVFKKALENVVTAFVGEQEFKNYINNKQEPIDDVGQIIEKMYFEETITIKPAYISVNEQIFTDAISLTQYLLFGSSKEQSKYVVKAGDTIASISKDNKLNPQEFLIANPKYKNETSILTIGEKVNITLIKPILTLVQNIYSIKDEEQVYDKEYVYDPTKNLTYSEITQVGIMGIDRITRNIKVVNGESEQGAEPISKVTIRARQNEITTKGGTTIYGQYVDNGLNWGWPTNRPYVITSGYEWRWGDFHNALDISGTGLGSPIYASRDGVVVEVNTTCANIGYYRSMCGRSYGNFVIIQHSDNYYTIYAHMLQNVSVKEGSKIKRGQVIGYMGSSGSSTGVHVHFGVSRGFPDQGVWLNPWSVFR